MSCVEFARLDFNMLQKLHQKELSGLTRYICLIRYFEGGGGGGIINIYHQMSFRFFIVINSGGEKVWMLKETFYLHEIVW